jgi:phosphonate transport system substrate-binding protein
VGIVSPNSDTLMVTSADDLASQIADLTGYRVETKVFASYPEMLIALAGSHIHITFLPPLTYIWSNNKNLATVAFLTNHFGVYQYGIQFLANVDSQFKAYYDPSLNRDTADAATALAQFQGKRPCWVDLESPSGYIVPASYLIDSGVVFDTGVVSQSHTAVVRALYVRGICDFGATFALSGDPRTASAIQADFPDVMNKIVVIWRSDAIIPNLNISYASGLPDNVKTNLTEAFQDIVKTDAGKKALTSATNYDIEDLKRVENSIYDPLRNAVDKVGINLDNLLGK